MEYAVLIPILGDIMDDILTVPVGDGVPENAIFDRGGDPIRDRAGDIIEERD